MWLCIEEMKHGHYQPMNTKSKLLHWQYSVLLVENDFLILFLDYSLSLDYPCLDYPLSRLSVEFQSPFVSKIGLFSFLEYLFHFILLFENLKITIIYFLLFQHFIIWSSTTEHLSNCCPRKVTCFFWNWKGMKTVTVPLCFSFYRVEEQNSSIWKIYDLFTVR